MKHSIASEAEDELTEAARFYAREANVDLGHAFIAEFERSIDLLRAHPRLGAPWRGATRRLPLRRFPYSIVYQLHPSELHREVGPGAGRQAGVCHCGVDHWGEPRCRRSALHAPDVGLRGGVQRQRAHGTVAYAAHRSQRLTAPSRPRGHHLAISFVASLTQTASCRQESLMPIPIEVLESEVLNLPPAQRSHPLDRLIASPDPNPEIQGGERA